MSELTDTKTQEIKVVPCEVYSRIVGYLRPVKNWNESKRVEFERRRLYQPGVFLAHTEGGRL